MTKEVTITVTAPIECTDEQFEEWVRYCTGYTNSISLSNPLYVYGMEAYDIDIN